MRTKKNIVFLPSQSSLFLFFCLLLIPGLSAGVNPNLFQSYIEKSPLGQIDWDVGMIYGTGRGYLKLNKESKVKSLQAAKTLAYGNVLRLAAGMRLDEKLFLKSLGGEDFTVNIEALVKPQSFSKIFVDDPEDPYYEVTLVAPLKGMEGLTSKILSVLEEKSVEELKPAKALPTPAPIRIPDEYEEKWLVLDGRNLQGDDSIQAALFPKIFDVAGQEVYQLERVDPNAVRERGMASYVVTDESRESIKSNSSMSGDFINHISLLLGPNQAIAAEKKSRKKRRRYIVKEVKESMGLNHTNLLISASDARELREEDSASSILKKCRVIVILASPSGGIEGRRSIFFAQSSQ